MLTDDEDRQFKVADIAEILAVVAGLVLVFWLLNPLNAWLRYPAILLGSVAVLLVWAAVRKALGRRRSRGYAAQMEPLRLITTTPDSHSLILVTEDTPADRAIIDAGHEPNGYFWQGVAERVAPQLAEHVRFDSEAGMFSAYGPDRAILERLGLALAPVVNDPALVREVIAAAAADGFEFDD